MIAEWVNMHPSRMSSDCWDNQTSSHSPHLFSPFTCLSVCVCVLLLLTAGCLGLVLELLVPDHSLEEVLSAAGVLDVLDADVQALGNDAVAHALVDLHSHCSRSDVPHEAGLAVVELVWHALLHGSVASDVDELADLKRLQEGARADGTTLALHNNQQTGGRRGGSEKEAEAGLCEDMKSCVVSAVWADEFPLEEVACVRPVTVRVRHGELTERRVTRASRQRWRWSATELEHNRRLLPKLSD